MSSRSFDKVVLEDNSTNMGEVSFFLPQLQKYYIAPKFKYNLSDFDLSFPVSEVRKSQQIELKPIKKDKQAK